MEPRSATNEELERRRRLRLVATWLAIAVFIAGNAAGLVGWIQWGPLQQNANERPWILASAFGFWLSSCLLLVLVFDTWLIIRHGATAPSYKDLDEKGPIRARANSVRRIAEKYRALVGVGGLVVGAVVAHVIWRP